MDTRAGFGKTGDFGPPRLGAGATCEVPIPQSTCDIPPAARAYSLNVTVLPPGPLGYLSVWPTGQTQPVVSTLNLFDAAVAANAAIVPGGTNGSINVFVSDASEVIIDINGYFAPPDSQAPAFYPAAPCRIVDTRLGSGKSGLFGPPAMGVGSTRNIPVPLSACVTPPWAYSLNMTVLPPGPLIYLTTWPADQPQPMVSTLNAFDGRVAANAAIVPAAADGSIAVFTSDASQLIIDINGFFGPPGHPGALYFYPATPCRVADTRVGFGKSGPFGPPGLGRNDWRDFPIPAGSCGLPPTAQAYSLNMVPPSALSYLTTWPTGQPQPVVSTLNSFRARWWPTPPSYPREPMAASL